MSATNTERTHATSFGTWCPHRCAILQAAAATVWQTVRRPWMGQRKGSAALETETVTASRDVEYTWTGDAGSGRGEEENDRG